MHVVHLKDLQPTRAGAERVHYPLLRRTVRDGVCIDGSEGAGFHFVDTAAAPPGSTRNGHAPQRLRDAVAWLRKHGDPSTLQVLTPMKRRTLGTGALNEMLQNLLNPEGAPGPAIGGGAQVRAGDRVIQVRNDHTLGTGIMNGQQGLVTGVAPGCVQVAFEDEILWIDGFRLYNLRLAWAITIHKSQGSEWDHVIVVADRSHGALLSRPPHVAGLSDAGGVRGALGWPGSTPPLRGGSS